jgi:hypothetical protein
VATIEIRTKAIGWSAGAQLGAHNYLVYTYEENGVTKQQYFSAHPKYTDASFGNLWGSLMVETGIYKPGTYDWQTSGIKSTILATGSNLTSQWNAILQCAADINSANLRYQPLGQNSNAAVATCLAAAGIAVPGGLNAFTNGLWTPSDNNSLFQDPVFNNGFLGLSPGGGGGSVDWQPVSYFGNAFTGASFSFGGSWVKVGTAWNDGPVSYSWKWVPSPDFAIRIKPLVLDLDGDGLEMSHMTASPSFDWNGDGWKQSTGWISGGDGFVVYDDNMNGVVDSGLELAMTYYSPGAKTDLEAMRAFDSNADGVLSAQDAAFHKLKVWVDANSNGVSDTGELTTLTERGITSIDLNGTAADGWVNGNHYSATTVVTFSNGAQITGYDVGIAASARGSKHLGTSGIWNVIESSSQEVLVSYNGADALDVDPSAIAPFGRTATAFFLGSGNDLVELRETAATFSTPYYINTGAGDDNVLMHRATEGSIIDTGDGWDCVVAGSGDDIISPGTGDFFLFGGAGNDLYRLQRGSQGWLWDIGDNDAIVFMDILRSETTLVRSGNDLIITAHNFAVTVADFFVIDSTIEILAFQDATLSSADLIASMGGPGQISYGFSAETTPMWHQQSHLLMSEYLM